MPTPFAYLALFSWPLVVFFLYRRLPRDRALIASILGGYLLLPFGAGINPPVLPTFDKTLMPALSALLMALVVKEPLEVVHPRGRSDPPRRGPARADERGKPDTQSIERAPFTRQRAPAADSPDAGAELTHGRPSRIGTFLLLLLFASPFLTVLDNSEVVRYGPRVLPGLRLYDAFSMGLNALVAVLPYLLARRYLATPRAHKYVLIGFVVWGLCYTLPTLWEIRMSPQLARKIYGFMSGMFSQAVRDGGYRPVVFVQSGIWLALFFAMALLAAAALWRLLRAEDDPKRGRWMLAMLWLLVILVLCKSLGALAEALLILPAALFLSVRRQLLVASVVAAIALTYPALRASQIIPVNTIMSVANTISRDRGQSLEFRLQNEDTLLAKAERKALTGWGGYDRNRIFNADGRDLSVTDGYWIIALGTSGWIGYIAIYGLLTAPIFLLFLRRKRLPIGPATGGLALMLTANLIDMIPNATLTPLTWMIAGALMGSVSMRLKDPAPAEPAQSAPPAGRARQMRFGRSRTA